MLAFLSQMHQCHPTHYHTPLRPSSCTPGITSAGLSSAVCPAHVPSYYFVRLFPGITSKAYCSMNSYPKCPPFSVAGPYDDICFRVISISAGAEILYPVTRLLACSRQPLTSEQQEHPVKKSSGFVTQQMLLSHTKCGLSSVTLERVSLAHRKHPQTLNLLPVSRICIALSREMSMPHLHRAPIQRSSRFSMYQHLHLFICERPTWSISTPHSLSIHPRLFKAFLIQLAPIFNGELGISYT